MADAHESNVITEGGLVERKTPWPEPGFEQRRALAAIRGRLFGDTEALHIGRYRIEGRLGAGGMGEVYLGFDPGLNRKVAIKCVRPEFADPLRHRRLQREAQALAQLSHPNVVQVYEVAEHEGRTFIAMEFVDGQTLADWLEPKRSWQDIVARFVAAGRGLTVAHAAGVVHRDFKPENVLIGDDGRVRVADFGLALSSPVTTDPASAELSRLTGANKLSGTVAYMAFEQVVGGDLTPLTDQFSFCVALYEALYQQPPYALDSVAARIKALQHDDPTPPPRGQPRRLWKILRRGLAREPEQRWPDLESLLHALEAVPRRRRRVGLAVAGLSLAGLLGGWPLVSAPADQCRAINTELVGIWDAEAIAAVRETFDASGQGHAPASFARLHEGLDVWAATWIQARQLQCDATRDGRDNAALSHARRSCLERQRRRVGVLVQTLANATPTLIERAVELADELPDPADCAADRVQEEPELDDATRERVTQLRSELAELAQLRLLGRGQPARVQQLVVQAETFGHLPLLAEALSEEGRTEIAVRSPARGLALLERASELALETGRERLLAELWLELALHQLTDAPDLESGRRNAKLARAQWARLEPDDDTRSRLTFLDGRIAELAGDRDGAAAAYGHAIELLGETQSSRRPSYLEHLAGVCEPERRLALLGRALAAAEQLWGLEHPAVGDYLYILGRALHQAHREVEALPLLDRAVSLWTTSHAEPHPNLAFAHDLLVLGALADYRENSDETARGAALERAAAHADLAATIRAQTLPIRHRDHGDSAMAQSRVAALRGDREVALAFALDALGHYEGAPGVEELELEQLRLDIADNELGLGRIDRAHRAYSEVSQRAVEPALLARAALGVAEVELRRGRLEQARAQLDAIELLGAEHLGGQILSAEILRAIVDHRSGCEACTTRARAQLGVHMDEAGWSRAAIRGWLDELGVNQVEAASLGLE